MSSLKRSTRLSINLGSSGKLELTAQPPYQTPDPSCSLVTLIGRQVFGSRSGNCVRQTINKFLNVHFDSFIYTKLAQKVQFFFVFESNMASYRNFKFFRAPLEEWLCGGRKLQLLHIGQKILNCNKFIKCAMEHAVMSHPQSSHSSSCVAE